MAFHSSLLSQDLGNWVSLPYLPVTTRLFVFLSLTPACLEMALQKIANLLKCAENCNLSSPWGFIARELSENSPRENFLPVTIAK